MSILQRFKPLIHLALPITMGEIGIALIAITDILFVAQLGLAPELAAVTFVSTFYLTIYHSLQGLIKGGEIIIARRNGEGQHHIIGYLLKQMLLFMVISSVLTISCLHFFSFQILDVLLIDSDVTWASSSFLNYRIYGLLFGAVSEALIAFYVGVKHTKIIGTYMLCKVIANVVLNYGLIMGNFGLPALGIEGAAIASSIADFLGMLVIVGYTLWNKNRMSQFFSPNLNSNFFDIKTLLPVLNCGIPLMIQSFFAYGFYTLFFVLIEKMGLKAATLASMAVMVVEMAMIGKRPFSTITSSIVSNDIGAGQNKGYIFQKLHDLAIISTTTTVIIISLLYLFKELIIDLFLKNGISSVDAMPMFIAAIVTALVSSFFGIYYKGLVGTGATTLSMLCATISTTICHGGLAYWMIKQQYSISTVWYAETFYWVVLGVSVMIILFKKRQLFVKI